jgi:hypothetical protein
MDQFKYEAQKEEVEKGGAKNTKKSEEVVIFRKVRQRERESDILERPQFKPRRTTKPSKTKARGKL